MDTPPSDPPNICKYCGEPATKYDLLISSYVCDSHSDFSRTLLSFVRNDVGITDIDTYLECPGPGQPPLERDGKISVGVIESPGITGETSIITLQVRLVLSCD